jgi:drug/metabolite transporter (DMT)-like permease
MKPARLFVLTLTAMIAFAGNSLLCRAALKQTKIDAATFTFIRIFSGAFALWLVQWLLRVERTASPLVERCYDSSLVTRPLRRSHAKVGHLSLPPVGTWLSAFALFAYAGAFSFAYNTLSAGIGALLLFGAVQTTMILWGVRKGERLHARQLIGLALEAGGLVVLVFPGLSAPPLGGSALMLAAGIAWGIYSLRGKGAGDPISATAGNFIRAVPFAAVLSISLFPWVRVDRAGLVYAILSGAIASGLGYVIWYTALSSLKAASAATVQLSVPVLAATGGILLLGEPLTWRFLLAAGAVLGGIALVVIEKRDAV